MVSLFDMGMQCESLHIVLFTDELCLHFAVDLSENLSSDMKKEGICGRTLTLKLKTSSFEVLSLWLWHHLLGLVLSSAGISWSLYLLFVS